MVKVRYVDHREIWYPKLKAYPGGVHVKNGDEIKFSPEEWANQKDKKNGFTLCFEEIKITRNIKNTSEDIEHGSRE